MAQIKIDSKKFIKICERAEYELKNTDIDLLKRDTSAWHKKYMIFNQRGKEWSYCWVEVENLRKLAECSLKQKEHEDFIWLNEEDLYLLRDYL